MKPQHFIISGVALIAVGVSIAFSPSRHRSNSSAKLTPKSFAKDTDFAESSARSPANVSYDLQDLAALARQLSLRRPSDSELQKIVLELQGRRNDLFQRLGRLDFLLAVELAKAAPNPEILIARAVWGYAEVEPDRALEWALNNGKKSRQSDIGNEYLRSWAAGTFAEHREILYQFIERFPPGQSVLTLRHDAIAGIVAFADGTRRYAEVFSDRQATALVSSLQYDPRVVAPADSRLFALATSWARSDAVEMLRFASNVIDPIQRGPVLRAAIVPYMGKDPEAGIAWAIRVDPDESLGVVRTGFLTWVNSSNDRESVMRWAKDRGLPQAYLDTATALVSARLGALDYTKGYHIALGVADPVKRADAISRISRQWRDDENHFEYVRQSGNVELMGTAIAQFNSASKDRALQVLERMPDGPEKTVARGRLAHLDVNPVR